MNRLITKSLALVALVGGVILATPAKSDAAFWALICNDAACDGAGDIIVLDGGGGDTLGGIAGIINIAGVGVGGLTVTTNIAQSKPLIGSAAAPSMDVNFTATGVGTAWIYGTDTGFTGTSVVSGSLDGNFGGSGSVQAFIAGGNDNTNFVNAGPNTLDLTSLVSSATVSTSPFSIPISKAYGGVSPYFLTIGVKVTRDSAGGTTTGDLLVVPEPVSLSLLGLGLVGIAARRRRKA